MFSLTPWKREKSSGALAQRDPFQLMRDDFQNLFDRFFGEWPAAFSDNWNRGWGLDVEEKDNKVMVRAELPGFDVKDIDVQMVENVLTIEAKHTEEGKEGDQNGSRHYNHVRRSFTVPTGLDVEKIEASYRNGVLEIHIPRAPEAQGRKIEIKT